MDDRGWHGRGRRDHDYSNMYDEPMEGDNNGWSERYPQDYDRRDSPRRGGEDYRRHRDYDDDERRGTLFRLAETQELAYYLKRPIIDLEPQLQILPIADPLRDYRTDPT